jgi:hypothetical protein
MPLRTRFALPALLAAVALAAQSASPAQDKEKDKEAAKKARAAAVENLKKAKIDKPTVEETDNFLVAGSITEAKAKALGAVLEKVLPAARKAAKYDEKESAWKGKLTVYFLPDGDEYKAFMRRVLVKRDDEGQYADFRTDPPLLVDPADLPGKPSDAELFAATAARMAGEHLKAKGTGSQAVPEWLRDGFGRVVVMKATGSAKYAAYKNAAKNAIFNPKSGKPPMIADVGSGERSVASDALANSLAEFLAYGPKAADFGKFLDALRPSDTVQNPSVLTGLMALGWKDEASADASWKQWVRTGK